MVQAKKLTKQFKDKKRGVFNAVDAVDFSCAPGTIFGLLGANGAGKTTTLRMISTLMKPSDGTIVVDGFDTQKQPRDVRRRQAQRHERKQDR